MYKRQAHVDDGIHKSEQLLQSVLDGKVPVYHSAVHASDKNLLEQNQNGTAKDSLGHTLYKHLMYGISHMIPFVVGGGIMIAIAYLLDDYSIDPANFGMNTPAAAFFKTVGSAVFNYMLPILASYVAISIAGEPALAVGFAGGVLAMNGTNFTLSLIHI